MKKKGFIDPQGRVWRTNKDKINELVELMNKESLYPMQSTDELLYVFDAVLDPEEINFMLEMGGGNHTLKSIRDKIDLPEKEIKNLIDSLVHKGPIVIIKDKSGNNNYHLMSIFVGWFELYLMRGKKNKDTKLFAQRLETFINFPSKLDPEMVNELMKDAKPFFNVLAAGKLQPKTIQVDQEIEPGENIVFPTKRVLSIFEQLDEDEIITVGNCFCRFQKQLVKDNCRVDFSLEACISIGPAAQYLRDQGIAKQISKADAISRIKRFQEMGAIHQTTPTIPIKDFQLKYPYDRFCNCCWDCCTLIGAYNRGQMPYLLKRFHKVVLPDPGVCTGCEECISYCPTSAISINTSGKAEVKDEFCIGCGHCYYHCNTGAFELIEDERTLFLPILEKSQVRIKSALIEEDKAEAISIDENTVSDKNEVLEALNKFRQRFLSEENVETFKNWTKTFQFHFKDIDEHWYFEVKEGIPSELKEGKADNPDIIEEMSGTTYIKLVRGMIDFMKAKKQKLIKVNAALKDLIKLGKLV